MFLITRRGILLFSFAVALLASGTTANAANMSSFISDNIPATMTPGQVFTATVTFQNTGTTTWTETAGYKIGTQNPQDNELWHGWGRVFMNPGESIPPGQQKSFTFTITAPTVKGTYNFQWQMIEELVEWFGPKSTNRVVMVTPNAPPFPAPGQSQYPNPNDSVPDDDALQWLLNPVNGGGEIRLAPPTAPATQGYTFKKGLKMCDMNDDGSDDRDGCFATPHGITINTSQPDPNTGEPDPNARPIFRADGSLAFNSLIWVFRRDNLTLKNLIFDGNRDARSSNPLCTTGNRVRTGNIDMRQGANWTIENVHSSRALCGASISVNGTNVTVTGNQIADNGTGEETPTVQPEMWADGIRADCLGGNTSITNNVITDSTDIGIAVGKPQGLPLCTYTITGNTVDQTWRQAFGGMGFPGGAHHGSAISNNTIIGGGLMGIGLAIGAGSWVNPPATPCGERSFGGEALSNTISGAHVNLYVENSDQLVHSNTIGAPQGTLRSCASSKGISIRRCVIWDATGVTETECSLDPPPVSLCGCIP